MSTSVDATQSVPTNHPTGFWYIFTGELAERASFYGMKAVLTMYLVHVFAYKKADASSTVHLYVAACYFAPLLGGLIADRLLNKYWTIVGFSLPYILGQFIVGLSSESLMIGALALLSLGSGVIKPNISTLMGLTYDQQRPGQDLLRSKAFSYYYMAVNIGSFLSTVICPWLRDYFGEVGEDGVPTKAKAGYFAAFLFPAILMTVALLLFALGKKHYAVEPLGYTKWGKPEPAADPNEPSKWTVVGQISGLFILVAFFWAIFDQHASTWIYFAEKNLELNVNLGITKFRLPPDSIQAANPFFIVLFIPILNALFTKLAAKGYKIRATDKMIVGFLLTAATMAIHAIAGTLAQSSPTGKVSILWQLFAFVVLTIAEILISVTGLELAFTAAPASMKGFVTSLWLVTVGLANLFINTPVTRLYPSEQGSSWQFASPVQYFMVLTIAMLIVTACFYFIARKFNRSQAK